MNGKKDKIQHRSGSEQSVSLLTQLGGEKALSSLLGAFYFNVLRDDRLARFFVNADVDSVRNHQHVFLTAALGDDTKYIGRNLGDVHRTLIRRDGLNQIHFNAMTAVLAATISEFGHSAELRDAIVERVRALATEILDANSNPEKPTE